MIGVAYPQKKMRKSDIPKDFRNAIEHFVEAANIGNEKCSIAFLKFHIVRQFNLGVLYANIIEKDSNYDILQEIVIYFNI